MFLQIKQVRFILVILLLINLCSCSDEQPTFPDKMSQHRIDVAQISLLNRQLKSYGTRIFENNDSMVIEFPAEELFVHQSANLTYSAYNVLDLTIKLLLFYEKSVVEVVGFAGRGVDENIDTVLAEARAQKVVQYLWGQGIDANLMYAVSHQVSYTRLHSHLLRNCVIISFRKLPTY
ncbi:MAG: OmpA family protein [Gammaproteobacteria bacterium]|nr:OmpA family protein [Gammaproteobacteria bacterium]